MVARTLVMVAVCCAAVNASGELVRVEFEGTEVSSSSDFLTGQLKPIDFPSRVDGFYQYDPEAVADGNWLEESGAGRQLRTEITGIALQIMGFQAPLPEVVNVQAAPAGLLFVDPRDDPYFDDLPDVQVGVTSLVSAVPTSDRNQPIGSGRWSVLLQPPSSLFGYDDSRQLAFEAQALPPTLVVIWNPDFEGYDPATMPRPVPFFRKYLIDSIRVVPEPPAALGLVVTMTSLALVVWSRKRPVSELHRPE